MNENMQKKAEEFVLVWQSSKSLPEASKRLNLSRQAVNQRVFNYRNRGITLKFMRQQDGHLHHLDWNKLKEIALNAS